jgi:hypothetical protein
VVFEYLYSWLGCDGRDEGTLDLAARQIRRVQDTTPAVSCLASEREALFLSREIDSPFDELADALRPLAYEFLDGPLVAESGSRHQRVSEVQVRRVGRIEHGGDASLGVIRVRFHSLFLRRDEYVGIAGGLQREAETGDTASDYEYIGPNAV